MHTSLNSVQITIFFKHTVVGFNAADHLLHKMKLGLQLQKKHVPSSRYLSSVAKSPVLPPTASRTLGAHRDRVDSTVW